MLQVLHIPATSRGSTLTPIATARLADRGFSLFELVLVMVIVVTISAIAIPRMSSSTNNARADQAVDRIQAMYEQARSIARARSTTIAFKVSRSADRINIKIGTKSISKAMLNEAPYHADITARDFAGDGEILIDGLGMPDSGGTLTLVVGTTTRTLTFDGPPSSDSTLRTSTLLRSTELDAVDSGLVTKGATGAGQVVQ